MWLSRFLNEGLTPWFMAQASKEGLRDKDLVVDYVRARTVPHGEMAPGRGFIPPETLLLTG